jgi:CheY-like chemotaxis protein
VQADRAELFEARNGNTALEMLQSDQFDCLILDLELPDFSGFELLERATRQGIALPPVVVYTNKSLSYEESLALREYTDSIVVKGERSPERLADEVSLFLHSVESSLPSRHQPAPASAHVKELAGKTVLVVDDDMRNAFALSKVLRGKGLSVLLAQDGHKALAQLDESEEIHVVLMDIMMPGIDGYDTIREIRKQPRFGALPIVALTAKAMPGDREKCIRVGANDYFSKPVDIEQLISAMSSLV